MPPVTINNRFGRSLALSLLTACGLIALGLVVTLRLSRAPQTRSDSRPQAAVPADSGAPASAERARTAMDVPVAQPDDVRPETALLQDLPKARTTRAPDSPLYDLRVSFKLEPRLTRSLHMGDRWTSPPTYLQVGAGEDCTLEAGIRGLNAQKKAVLTPATWRAADPDMVKISEQGPGNTVKLTVTRPGRTTVEIMSEGITKELPLHAVSYGGTLLVAMGQE